jgi:hypothetical protein
MFGWFRRRTVSEEDELRLLAIKWARASATYETRRVALEAAIVEWGMDLPWYDLSRFMRADVEVLRLERQMERLYRRCARFE